MGVRGVSEAQGGGGEGGGGRGGGGAACCKKNKIKKGNKMRAKGS